MSKIPKRYKEFMDKYPAVGDAYEKMGEAVHQTGPLDEKTRALIKLQFQPVPVLKARFIHMPEKR
ncbi:MAG: hypothetical protein AMXMBFR48_02710 [Ignavibacteriales bacterium]